MIFVTVGTHEQQFNRLVEYMDKWAIGNDEEVVIQTGFSTYEPKRCEWSKLYPYEQMLEFVDKARIVITHGGPSSFIMPLQTGKIPIVVPRNHEFGEHVNNHQIDFCRKVAVLQKNIILVEDVEKLGSALETYELVAQKFERSLNSNNTRFCEEFGRLISNLFEKGKV